MLLIADQIRLQRANAEHTVYAAYVPWNVCHKNYSSELSLFFRNFRSINSSVRLDALIHFLIFQYQLTN